jgi:hypothetical protein
MRKTDAVEEAWRRMAGQFPSLKPDPEVQFFEFTAEALGIAVSRRT